MVFNTGAALLDAIVLAVVSREQEGTYGYKITQDVRRVLDVSESTMYPVLRRLQKDECLEVYDMEFGGRNRRYYRITEQGSAQLSLYEQLCFYIDEHLSEDLSLERLAAELFVSKYHIAHVFKDEIGMSIHQYISKKRLARCREALLGDVPVTKVYLLFGFHDYSSFYRAFKKEYGISPKDFKELHTVTSD